MTTNVREHNKIWLMVKMSLGLMLLILFFPIFQQSVYATSNGQKIQFKPDSYSVNENGGYVDVQIERVGGSFDTVASVTYCTCNDTAVAPSDFLHTPGTLIFYQTEHEKTIRVQIVNDNEQEGDQQFFVWLKSITGDAALGEKKRATVVIHDDNDKIIPTPTPSAPTPTDLPKSDISLLSVAIATPVPEVIATPAPTDTSTTPTPTPTPKVVLADTAQQQASVNQSSSSEMPNTATPWYNYMVVGSLLVLLSGTMLYRRIAAFRRE